MDEILQIEDLQIGFETPDGILMAVQGVDLAISTGETLGLVGESGSGKSTIANAVMRYLDSNGRILSGDIKFKGKSLLGLGRKDLQQIRGNEISMIFQDPENSLNPALTIGEQILEVIQLHQNIGRSEGQKRCVELLEKVNIPDPRANLGKYPHQMSGGQKQRVIIAMALACEPELLILDEPTTALDVTTEAKILDLLAELKEELDTASLYITHDLGVISQVSDRIAIMYAGEIMEKGSIEEVLFNYHHPYTEGLLKSIPRITSTAQKLTPIEGYTPDLVNPPQGCVFYNRCRYARDICEKKKPEYEEVVTDHISRCEFSCEGEITKEEIEPDSEKSKEKQKSERNIIEINNLKKYYGEKTIFQKIFNQEDDLVRIIEDVNLEVKAGETLGLVGESGCGKTTIGKLIIKLHEVTGGHIKFDGNDIANISDKDKDFRKRVRIIFQNPDSSLNPKKSIREILTRPLQFFNMVKSKNELEDELKELMRMVNLKINYLDKRPQELSGGEKQRVAIARAFLTNPDFIVCDEPTSALDVSVQASIINLLMDLQERFGTAYLFISHDLSVVKHISDKIAVMYLGDIVELGETEEIFAPPYHPYTRALLSAVPKVEAKSKAKRRIRLQGAVPSAKHPPSGCRFVTRCPEKLGEICEMESGSNLSISSTHNIFCHQELEKLASEKSVSQSK